MFKNGNEFANNLVRSTCAKECQSCKSRNMLQHAPNLAVGGVDTAENGPSIGGEYDLIKHRCALLSVLFISSALNRKYAPISPALVSVGLSPIYPSMCWRNTSNSQPYVVLVKYSGVEFAVIPDTGSSNLVVASERCGKDCDLSPRWKASAAGTSKFIQTNLSSLIKFSTLAESSHTFAI